MIDYEKVVSLTKNFKVLYAEDDEILAEICEDTFKMFFKEVISVSNGLDALQEYENQKFDLVILDIEMPLMNGIEVAKKILSINFNQDIIFLTAFDEVKDIEETPELSILNYLLKPLDAENFGKLYFYMDSCFRRNNKIPSLLGLTRYP